MTIDEKYKKLDEILRGMESTIVAFSGGVDSAFLAFVADRVLGDRALAVTADSPSLASFQREDALRFAGNYGLRHEMIRTEEMENPDYVVNPANRCFFCKDELFQKLTQMAAERGFRTVAYGVNVDDLGDYRPGQQAARKFGVSAPLVDAQLRKSEIRELSRALHLETWDHPASACLSSRIPYGMMVTVDKLKAIDRGEEALHRLGFRQVRVRHHGEVVRIEIASDEMPSALKPEMAKQFTSIFKSLGFKYVTLDLEGYRQGALNEVLTEPAIRPS
ncbi:MAG: ATP-dependent sacrificial sulfur transferase LarE [Acidobacteriia bacterium]|nr:ATP-dependent sacrificial sulfur transferase LarE [Terriglobia bacterium]